VTAYVGLLRAVNVGGRLLKMDELKRIAGALGYGSPRTYIASGNLLFDSDDGEAEVKRELESAISAHMGKPVEVMVRTAEELAGVVAANPFASEQQNRVVTIFFDKPPPADAVQTAKNISDERLALGRREIYVHYPSGLGRSKLRLAGTATGTARNMNTVAKVAALAREMA
jgi:uncharacterized protein (DUF1697 family)